MGSERERDSIKQKRNTIVKEIICIILNFLADSLKKETDEINFNVRFYLDQYIQTLI